MKELSIKEKAKRYDEAIERAKGVIEQNPLMEYLKKGIEYILPELKESEDAMIIRELTSLFKDGIKGINHTYTGEDCERWVAWLEKQGEQKPADKVEPKFHEGEWIVFNGLTLLINEVVQGYYRTISRSGIPNSYGWDIDNIARLWTIQDAKDGDVLTYSDSKHTWLCIFKELKNQRCYDYCSYSNKDEVGFWPRSNWNYDKTLSYKPATKEQRDTLMKAIADAGYIFDFEKKELKKIEQKQDVDIQINPEEYINDMGGNGCYLKNTTQASTWSEEDEKMLRGVITMCDIWSTKTSFYPKESNDIENLKNWFKSIKERVQPKQEWSEEDKEQLDRALYMMEQLDMTKSWDDVYNWLKSLKDRYTWKPSEEQIKALERECMAHSNYDLCRLCEQLKKLREE